MLHLPNITLIIVDCLETVRAEKSISKCLEKCSFGDIKFLTSLPTHSPYRIGIPPINSFYEYSKFILEHIYEYCNTSHMQIIQHDSWILHPETWEEDWPRYDYIGSIFRSENRIDNDCVGNGGFSLRSKNLMEFVSHNLGPLIPNWGWYAYFNEDGVICKGMKDMIVKAGFNICPPQRAAKYAFEGNVAYFYNKPFGFHGSYGLDILEHS